MTAITYDGATPTINADADTWGAELNTGALGKIKVDLDMLNASPTARILGRVTAGTGEVERLTGAQVVSLLPATELTAALTPGRARKAGAYVELGVGAVGLVTGFNVASVTYISGGVDIAIAQVTFTTAMANAFYQVALGFEANTPDTYSFGISSKTVNGFRFAYAASFHTGLGISVFEAP